MTCGRGPSESSVGPTWKKFRNYDKVLVNPHDRRQRVRIQMVWNGHPEHYGLHWGLRTYTDPGHQVCGAGHVWETQRTCPLGNSRA